MYFVKTPRFVQLAFPRLIWRIPVEDQKIFLTFDDGPDPQVTPQALQLLDQFKAKATFFCVGENAEKHPSVIQRIRDAGHAIGNHSYSHLNGRRTAAGLYISDILRAHRTLQAKLFRPPYGKITSKQVSMLRPEFKIIMYTVLAGDFDPAVSKEEVLKRITRHTRKGDIVVLHDNPKFRDKTIFALEGMLRHFTDHGFKFVPIEDQFL